MKSFMKVLGLLVVVMVGAFGVVGCGSSGSSSTSATSASTPATTAATAAAAADADAEKPGPAYLFSFYGTDATVKRVAGSEVAYDVSVPVDAAIPGVTWFTDRPNRDAGTMSYEALASLWTKEGKDSFTADPPNVSIVFGSGKGQPKTAIAKMSNTKIVDNPNGNGQLLQATMTMETSQEAAALAKADGFVAAQAKNSTILKTITNADTKHFAVFIDDYASANGCSYTNDWCTNNAGAPGDAQWGSCWGTSSAGAWSNYANSIYNSPTSITCMGPGYNGRGLDVHGHQHYPS
ncbi:MAG: hypothetical protein WCK20_03400 [Thermoleophilia bacterium]